MKRSLLTFTVAATVGMGSFLSGPGADRASASILEDLQNKQNQLQSERSGVQTGINEANSEISRLQGEQNKVQNEIASITAAINDTTAKIDEKTQKIDTTRAEIVKLQEEIKVLVDRINKRNEMLKERARSYQANGGMVSYMDVLAGSQDFSDFIDRVGAVATIVEADQGILREHQKDKALLEQTQAQVEKELADLEKMLQELETLKKDLDSQKAKKDELMSQLQGQEDQKQSEKLNMEEQDELLAAQESAMQQAVQNEQQRLAEAARQQELAQQEQARQQEAARQQELAKQNAQKPASSAPSVNAARGSSPAPAAPAPAVSAGAFTKPTTGRLTSVMGERWNKFHAGIDIANSGTVPIVAAADGVVIRSYFSSSYGNVIFLSHSINGQTYTTVYAHMASRVVTGGTVSKGQLIGYMGNTGESFGQHLHFELHKGAWNAAKSNAVNPLDYIPM